MTGLFILIVYIAIFVISNLAVRFFVHRTTQDYTSLKTVTFGDESTVRPNRIASVVSVVTVFLIWGSFTGSSWVPGFLHAPAPFVGETSFTYTLEGPDGARDDAVVHVRVFDFGEDLEDFEVEPGDGIAKDDAVSMNASRSETILFDRNDEVTRKDGAKVVAIDGNQIGPDAPIRIEAGRFALTSKGAISYAPPRGLQMEPIWLPPPEDVVKRFIDISREGFRNYLLHEHLGSRFSG